MAALVISWPALSVISNDIKPAEKSEIKNDYVTDCHSANCAMTRATQWSNLTENHRAVAVSVRMGTIQNISDVEIKTIITKGFNKFGIENLKFFFELNDTVGTGILFHVRGGTDGMYTLNQTEEIKEAVKRNSRLARIDLFK